MSVVWPEGRGIPDVVDYTTIDGRLGGLLPCLAMLNEVDADETWSWANSGMRGDLLGAVRPRLISNVALASAGEAVLRIVLNQRRGPIQENANGYKLLSDWKSVMIDGFNAETAVSGRASRHLGRVISDYDKLGVATSSTPFRHGRRRRTADPPVPGS